MHSEHQYDGLLKGVGVTSKEPVCSKRNTLTKRIHDATHFAVGCHKWDDPAVRLKSRSHWDHPDHQVVYTTVDAPDKNASIVELRTQQHRPDVHYRTEQRERFDDRHGPQPMDLPFRAPTTVMLGDDKPPLIPQSHWVHGPIHQGPEADRSRSLLAGGLGSLNSNSILPRPEKNHVIHGGPKTVDNYELGVEAGYSFKRYTGNQSSIIYEANTRNPVLGHHIPHAGGAFEAPHMRKTCEQIAEHNSTMPRLRSLGALRPF